MFAAIAIDQLIVPIVVALITAITTMSVAWKRLKLLGSSEKGVLEAQKSDIIHIAEDRATARALEALKLALEATERSRDHAYLELQKAHDEINELRDRVTILESIAERRVKQIHPSPKRRKNDKL